MRNKSIYLSSALLLFLLWFCSSLFYSTGEEWWSVYSVQHTGYNTYLAVLSWEQMLAFAVVALVLAFVPYKMILK
ncbi:hypothetical protein ACFO9Q_19195 [Paenibacillus sp. GCM10023252]|uniref:hypothetical protein n=1 Tax=Paenibacillus sp. GCM10023252 TaxID=3252649 RepID=UPI00361D479F